MKTFEEQAVSVRAKPHSAQILLELDGERKTMEEALRVLKEAGAEPFRYTHLRHGKPLRILIELSSPDMREVVRRLSEAGFLKVMGINARQADRGTETGGQEERA